MKHPNSLFGPATLCCALAGHTLALAGMEQPSVAGPSGTQLPEFSALGSVVEVRNRLAAGDAPDEADVGGITPLYVACQNGHSQIATLLLEAKASPDLTIGDGRVTPLLISCSFGHIDCVNALVRHHTTKSLSSFFSLLALSAGSSSISCSHRSLSLALQP